MNTSPLATLRALKGAPLAALVALAIIKIPTGAERIARITGYSIRPTMEAVRLLEELGYITRNSRFDWQINTSGLQQLPILAPEIEEKDLHKMQLPPPTTTTINANENLIELKVKEVAEGKGLAINASPEWTNPDDRVRERLRSLGIGEPKRSQLCQQEHICLVYLHRITAQIKKRGQNTGLLIHALEKKDDMPEDETSNAFDLCEDCPRQLDCPWYEEETLDEN